MPDSCWLQNLMEGIKRMEEKKQEDSMLIDELRKRMVELQREIDSFKARAAQEHASLSAAVESTIKDAQSSESNAQRELRTAVEKHVSPCLLQPLIPSARPPPFPLFLLPSSLLYLYPLGLSFFSILFHLSVCRLLLLPQFTRAARTNSLSAQKRRRRRRQSSGKRSGDCRRRRKV